MQQSLAFDLNSTLDQTYLKNNTMGDGDLLKEVLKLFLKQAQILIEQLQQNPEQARVVEIAHTMKGSANAIGAFRLASAASALEMGAERGAADLPLLYGAFYQTLDEAKAHIQALID